MKFQVLVVLGCLTAAPALAQEPVGCDKFKWPLEQERSMLTRPNNAAVSSGGSVTQPPPVAVKLALVPFAEAKLPQPPERAPRLPQSFAGFIKVGTPAKAGTHKISLSADAWIDVVQAGHFIKSAGFSGATGCEGLRKSVKFDLAAEPFVVQLSNAADRSIAVVITGD
jgi:hypothetical protein